MTRENYELASCKLNKEIKLKFGEVEYLSSFYWGSIAHKEENDSFESLMDEVSKKTGGKISGKSLIRVNHSGRFFLETEWGKLSVVNAESIIDSDKNILFFDASLMPVDEEFIRLGGCLCKKPQKVVLSPSHKKQLLNVVFEGEDIESQCKKHILYYKFIEK